MAKRVGILTGGGDCPGLNPAIRGAATRLLNEGYEVIGLGQGWKGLLEQIERPLNKVDVEEILWRGGTILESSRTNPFNMPDGVEKAKAGFRKLGLDALVAIGETTHWVLQVGSIRAWTANGRCSENHGQ